MPLSPEISAPEPTGRKRFTRASVTRGARRVGVIAVAAAFATPLALPAFASGAGTDPLDALPMTVAQDAQSVSGVVTAGESGLDSARLDVRATTAEELAVIRAELEAAAAAELEAAAAAEQEERTAAAGAARIAEGGGSSPSTTPVPAGAPAGASGSAIASAALAQVGVSQDCVQLVRKSIAVAGLPYTGMSSLFNLGPRIPLSQASAGDVIYYADGGTGRAHIGIYIGGGRAVHGGWSGYNTVVAGVDIGGSAPVFIDIT